MAAKLAVVEQMRAQREEATRGHVAETLGWLQEWQSDRDCLAHYDSELIVLAAERTRAAMAAYRGGSGALSAVLDARRMEIASRPVSARWRCSPKRTAASARLMSRSASSR